ncbi:MAG: hypothetical protein AB1546_01830 [bacterium]
MKSALEIALEKTKDIKPKESEYIPEDKKDRIREINKEFDAKIAELETNFTSRLKSMQERYGAREVSTHLESFYAELRREKDLINEDRHKTIEKILQSGKK